MILEFAQAKRTIRELSNSFHPLNPIRINLLSLDQMESCHTLEEQKALLLIKC